MTTALRYTIAEFERFMEENAREHPEERFELIRGELRPMPVPNPLHENVVDLLNYWSVDHANRREVRVRIQNSLGIPSLESVTVPDVAWMKARDYSRVRPQPSDVLLLIEVAESSLAYDRSEKADLFAAAGIKDYWIVNLTDRVVEVHRKPRGGTYREVTKRTIGDTIRPVAAPDVELAVAALFSD